MWQWGVVLFMLAGVPAGDEAEAATERARTALAEQLQVDAEAIEVLEVEPADWPNAALGCPEKGKVYAQVLMSGYRVHLGHEGRSHWLHVAGKRVVSCAKDAGGKSRTASFGAFERVIREARRDLAERLGIEEAAVEVQRVQPMTRTTVLQRCSSAPPPREDKKLPLLLREGGEMLLLTLRAEDETHHYRLDGGLLTYCGTP